MFRAEKLRQITSEPSFFSLGFEDFDPAGTLKNLASTMNPMYKSITR